MKYFVFAILAAVVGGGIYFAVHRPVTDERNGSPQSDGSYQLIVLADSVSIQHEGQPTPQPVTDTAEVSQGDRIVTSADGRARLSYPDGTITTLEPNTDITISVLSDRGLHSRISLNVGDIWSKVTRILGSDEYYEVQTNEAVAAVRGTVFRMVYRDRHATVQGVEHSVRLFARNTDGTTDEASGTDVSEKTQADVDASTIAVPAGQRRLTARRMTQQELSDPVFERIRKERDVSNDKLERVQRGPSLTPTPPASATPLPSRSPVVSVRPSATPNPVASLPPFSLPPIPTGIPPISSILPYISVPPTSVTLEFVSPKTVTPGANFSVNGTNFYRGRTANVVGVLVGYQPAEFHIIDAQTMFVTAPKMAAGIYEITVTTQEGTLVNLKPGITIQ